MSKMNMKTLKTVFTELTGESTDGFLTAEEICNAFDAYMDANEDTAKIQPKDFNEDQLNFVKQLDYIVDKEKNSIVYGGGDDAPATSPKKVAEIKATPAPKKGKTATPKDKAQAPATPKDKKPTPAPKDKKPKKEATPKLDIKWADADFSPITQKTYIDEVKIKASRISMWSKGKVHFKIQGTLKNKINGETYKVTTVAEIVKIISEFEKELPKYAPAPKEKAPKKEATPEQAEDKK